MNTIGHNIKRLRTKKNITQDEMAEALHVSRQTISNWERGKNEPNLEMLSSICAFFQVELSELIEVQSSSQAKRRMRKTVEGGISFGSCLAIVISWTSWHSIPWAIFHGLCSWAYILYYWIRY